MTAALGLARRDLAVRLLDQGDGPSIHSKAFVVHPRTLESLHPLGVAQPIADETHQVLGSTIYGRDRELARIDVSEVDSPFPGMYVLPQSRTELILVDPVEEEPRIDLRWNTEVLDVECSADEVDVELADGLATRP